MSRSRKKFAKTTFATGSNTDYYKRRNRDTRRHNRMNLRNWMAHKQIEDVADEVYTMKHTRNKNFDPWMEPTDGSYVVWKEDEFWTEEERNKLLRK